MIDPSIILDRLGKKAGLNLQYFLASGLWVSVRYVLMGLLSLAISVAFARLGGKELYGQYQFILAIVAFLSILSIPGLNIVSLKAVAKGAPNVLIAATRVCFKAAWLASLAVLVIGIYYLNFRGETAVGWSLVTASLLIPFFYGPNGWYTYYEGNLDFRSPTKRVLLTNGLVALVILLGLFQHWSLAVLVGSYFLINAVLSVFFYLEVKKKIREPAPKNVDVKNGVFYTLQKSSSALPQTIQPLIISSFFGYGTLGVFMIAYTLVNSASGLVGALSATYFPLLMKYTKLWHRRIIFQNLVLGILLAGAYWVFVKLLFVPLYGANFLDSYSLARYFAVAVALLPLQLYFQNYFTANTRPGLIVGANLASFAVALAVFLGLRGTGITQSLIGYVYALGLSSILILGLAYWRENKITLRIT
jgi:O-antigen/teichoic acid export membrane protein